MEISSLKAALGEIGGRIQELEGRRRQMVSVIKEIKDRRFRIGNLTKDAVINPVEKVKVSGRVGGVDGGLLAKSFHGVDIVMTRAVGVIFEYRNGKVVGTEINSQKVPLVRWVSAEHEGELVTVASLYRMGVEIGKAIELAGKVDFLLLDGPLYPHPSTRVAKGSELKKKYMEIVRLYNTLEKKCREAGTRLVGVVEDSRSNYFSKLLEKVDGRLEGVSSFRDTALLFDTLETGERTLLFKISNIQDLSYKNDVYGFYIKSARYDRPIRVEFISGEPGKDVDEVARLVYSIAAFPRYGLPSVLVEADLRAKLKQNYIRMLQRAIFSKSRSPIVMNLRRENSPL